MIDVGETLESAAEVTFTLPRADDPSTGLTGVVWTDAGDGTTAEVKVRWPGDVAFANAPIAKIVEIGFGRYAVRGTPAQCVLAGNAYIYANVAAAQPFFGSEIIGDGGGDIAVGGDGVFPFFLPNVDDPIFGAPVAAFDFGAGPTTALVKLRLPGGAYQDAKVADIVNLGLGGWGLKLAAAAGQTTNRGKAYLYADVPGAQRFEGYITILGSTGIGTGLPSAATPATSADLSGASELGDLALVWSNVTGDADLSLFGTDLASDRGLMTAVLLSLFTDRRAENDDVPPSGDPRDRRGWWADEFAVVPGDKFGSRLWLLARAKRTNENVLRAQEYTREALAWMIEDKVVASVDIPVTTVGTALLIGVDLQRPGRDAVSFRFAYTWDHLQGSA